MMLTQTELVERVCLLVHVGVTRLVLTDLTECYIFMTQKLGPTTAWSDKTVDIWQSLVTDNYFVTYMANPLNPSCEPV